MSKKPTGWTGDLANAGRGLLMGGADIIPGVSGGTVALILGIYHRLITALSSFNATLLGYLRRRQWQHAATHIDLRFLITLGIGIVAGVVCLADIMHYLLTTPATRPLTLAAFFGLILSSGVLVGRLVLHWSIAAVVLVVAGAVMAFWMTGLHGKPIEPTAGPPYAYIFLCGVIGICAMILPGISGAFILYMMGMYLYVTAALKAVKSILYGQVPGEELGIVLVFCVGSAVGLLTFSKVLRWLLSRYESPTMALLCGFMLGSLRKIWPFQQELAGQEAVEFKFKQFENVLPAEMTGVVWQVIAIAVAAIVFVFVLDYFSQGHARAAELEGSAD